MKYLVMECHSAYAVVLGDDGRFLKVANLHYEVGDTVSDVTELSIPQPKQEIGKLPQRKWIASLAAMAACLVLVIASLFTASQTPYASVYISINPEVRIDVNRKDIVVGVAGVNEDGVNLVSGYQYRNKNLDLVVNELVDLAIDMEYLHEGGKIVLSLDADDEWITSHQEHLSKHLNEHLIPKIPVIIDVDTKKHHDAEPVLPTAPIVIPVVPQDYSDSDYGKPQDDNGHTEPDTDEPDESDDDHDHGMTDYDDRTEPDDDHDKPNNNKPDNSNPGRTDYDDHKEPDDDDWDGTDYDDHEEPDDDDWDKPDDDDRDEPDDDDRDEPDDDDRDEPNDDDRDEPDDDDQDDEEGDSPYHDPTQTPHPAPDEPEKETESPPSDDGDSHYDPSDEDHDDEDEESDDRDDHDDEDEAEEDDDEEEEDD